MLYSVFAFYFDHLVFQAIYNLAFSSLHWHVLSLYLTLITLRTSSFHPPTTVSWESCIGDSELLINQENIQWEECFGISYYQTEVWEVFWYKTELGKKYYMLHCGYCNLLIYLIFIEFQLYLRYCFLLDTSLIFYKIDWG